MFLYYFFGILVFAQSIRVYILYFYNINPLLQPVFFDIYIYTHFIYVQQPLFNYYILVLQHICILFFFFCSCIMLTNNYVSPHPDSEPPCTVFVFFYTSLYNLLYMFYVLFMLFLPALRILLCFFFMSLLSDVREFCIWMKFDQLFVVRWSSYFLCHLIHFLYFDIFSFDRILNSSP